MIYVWLGFTLIVLAAALYVVEVGESGPWTSGWPWRR